MCIVCIKIANNSIKYYDARLLAGEFKAQMGEEHYKELMKALNVLDPPPIPDAIKTKIKEIELDNFEDTEYNWFPGMGID